MLKHVFAAVVALAPAAVAASTITMELPRTIVFGDSLSDAGTLSGQQFTNGDSWATQLGIDATSGRNFATGGATAADNPANVDFDDQRALFATFGAPVAPHFNAVVWFGGNDFLADQSPATGAAVLNALVTGIIDLRDTYGITRFLVPGLPDLSFVPGPIFDPNTDAAAAGQASRDFNIALQSQLANLAFLGIEATYFDLAGVFEQARNSALFDKPLTPCTFAGAAPDCQGYLFYDLIHPTEAAHALVAQAIYAELAPIPLPASGVLLLAGLGGVVALRRRKRAVAA